MKKKKGLKLAAFLVALVLLAGLGWLANGLVGNPVSKLLAKRTAEKRLEEVYGDTDFYIDSVSYSFKDGGYYAHIKSPTSIDSDFGFRITMGGELKWDDYETSVLSGWNTWQRLDREYRELTDKVFASRQFPFESDICFGGLDKLLPDQDVDEPEVELPEPREALVVDKEYDIQKLGKQYGELTVYIQDEEVTAERAAEMLLELKELMDARGATFYIIDFVLEKPKPEEDGDWSKRSDERVQMLNFRYDDICEEGLVERIGAANEAALAHFAALDAEREADRKALGVDE